MTIPARIHRTPTLVWISSAAPPWRSIQNLKLAGRVERLEREVEREQPEDGERDPAGAGGAARRPDGSRVLVRDVLFDGGAGGGHAALPSVVGPSIAPGLGGSAGASGVFLRGSSRQIAPDEAGRRDEHDDQRHG